MRKRKSKVNVDAARWAAYATAGLAASIGVQSIAEADIHILHPNVQLLDPFPGNANFGNFTYELAPGTSIVFRHAIINASSYDGVLLVGNGDGANLFIAGNQSSNYFYGSNLPYGQRIASLQSWIAPGDRVDLAWGFGYSGSQFLNQSGNIAFRFDVGNGTQYGWAELRLDSGVPGNIFTLTRLGWGDPGDQVFVGQVPEPGSLGLLTLGAVGLIAWRRNRQQVRA